MSLFLEHGLERLDGLLRLLDRRDLSCELGLGGRDGVRDGLLEIVVACHCLLRCVGLRVRVTCARMTIILGVCMRKLPGISSVILCWPALLYDGRRVVEPLVLWKCVYEMALN